MSCSKQVQHSRNVGAIFGLPVIPQSGEVSEMDLVLTVPLSLASFSNQVSYTIWKNDFDGFL